ncbi:hypothetical protein CsSME_00001415 [Camellia sinensis var. sinensis]
MCDHHEPKSIEGRKGARETQSQKKSTSEMKKAGLVFIPCPGIGHLVSIVEFAKRLIDRDDRFSITILVIKPPPSHPSIDSYTNSFSASYPLIQLIDLPQLHPPNSLELSNSHENYLTLYIESFKPHIKDVLGNLIGSTHSHPNSPRLVGLVLDFLCLSMIDVGNEFGLPSYLFLTSGAACLGLGLYIPTRHDRVSTEFSESDPEFLIPGFINPVPPRVLPSAVFNKDGGYAALLKLGKRLRDTKGIIVNTLLELESHAISSFCDDQTPPIYTVGPLIDAKGEAQNKLGSPWSHSKNNNIMKWLDDQDPLSVVFLCFGSMGIFGAPQLREIAQALERSAHGFLWSIRVPPTTTTQGKAENPEEMLPDGFIERTRGKGMVCGWAPQAEVLAHKAIGGFVSHCGWNSIMESLWNGVPLVTWPMYSEQQLNAFTMVRELGVAVEMRLDYRGGGFGGDVGDLVMADEIERAVSCVMVSDSDVREKVKEIGEKSKKALVEGGSSFNMIGKLMEDMLLNV